MAEQSDNNNTNKKPPLFPPNFVTLVQLKERWNREQERKQREKEEQEKQQRREEEKKLKQVVEEGESGSWRVKGEPINCGRRPIRRYTPINRSRKPEVLKVAIKSAVTDAESQGSKDSMKKKSGKGKKKKKGKIEDKARAENVEVIRGGENGEMIGGGENGEVIGGGENEEVIGGGENGDVIGGGENEEVIGGGENEEVIRGEEEAPSCQNVEKEIVPTRRERRPRGARMHFRPRIHNTSQNEIVKIEKKLGDLSVDGGNRRDHWSSRQKRYSNRGNLEVGRDNWRPRRPRESNWRNADMMWVKKGEVGDGNVV